MKFVKKALHFLIRKLFVLDDGSFQVGADFETNPESATRHDAALRPKAAKNAD